ncbi:MAG: hypothetical protein PHE60_03725 [Sulfurospirillaceae bacterium]|nr:hypothetical protein [Sulfurospirillaceae bacterium]
MELKDMILSTLKELDEVVTKEEALKPPKLGVIQEPVLEIEEEMLPLEALDAEDDESSCDTQRQFYINLRERILVLFEGFQSPNNKNIEAKIDLTLNFLEYLLATIDEQLELGSKDK